jgi:RNA polymerase sigma-70 factor, ECF subfamily
MVIIPELILLFLAISANAQVDWKQISEGIKNGDSKAFQTFYEAHYAATYRFLVSRGMRSEDAQDLIQKAFLMIWEKREHIDPCKSLKAYLFQIAYTRMLNHFQYQSKFSDEEPVEWNSSSCDPHETMDHSELMAQVKKIVASMPEKRGCVFEMCFLKEFTYKETAEILEVSVKTVENHMALAFKDMRIALLETYGEEQLQEFIAQR